MTLYNPHGFKTYKWENGLEGFEGMEPSCPKCEHANAMLNDWREAEKVGIKNYSEGEAFVCRDCGYVHVYRRRKE